MAFEVVRELIKCPPEHLPCQGGERESEVDATVWLNCEIRI
jgi:hypothetical protein